MTVSGQSNPVTYAYDNDDRLTGISQGTANVAFTYDAASRRTSFTLPNGVVVSYTYDSGSELTGISYQLAGASLGNLTYAYDLDGRRTQIGGSWARTGIPLPVSTTAYNAASELTQWGTATLTYDANGNMLSDGTNSYVWDARNQLASMNGSTISFVYDPFGRRLQKVINGSTTNFLYDGPNPVQELSGATVTANLLTGLGMDEYFARTDASGTSNFLTEALGSTIALADPTGTVQTQYTYDPFGGTTLQGATNANAYQFTGRENDGGGVYFYRARYYRPTTGRFISEDPIETSAEDVNLYRYVSNSPVNRTDPRGLGRWYDCGGGCGFRLERDPFKGLHVNWFCNGLKGCLRVPSLTPCETGKSSMPPRRILDCIRKKLKLPQPNPGPQQCRVPVDFPPPAPVLPLPFPEVPLPDFPFPIPFPEPLPVPF